MEPSTLNLDTRYNILRRVFVLLFLTFMYADVYLVSPNIHKTFVMNEWLLLPETDIIDTYYNAINTRKLLNIDAKVYQYTLIAHEDVNGAPIRRQKVILPQPGPMKSDDFTYYSYPYHDFPTIGSHARFFICNSGSKNWMSRAYSSGKYVRREKMISQRLWPSGIHGSRRPQQENSLRRHLRMATPTSSGTISVRRKPMRRSILLKRRKQCMAEVQGKLEGDGVVILSIVVRSWFSHSLYIHEKIP
ncbi:hypothetical protein EDB87DRAFT_1583673 [Lactarius vividus]|nr:hypothetical protein EDB87DRAFT_1583673 [Lactarius vividus]